jgi:hypothetical protein
MPDVTKAIGKDGCHWVEGRLQEPNGGNGNGLNSVWTSKSLAFSWN